MGLSSGPSVAKSAMSMSVSCLYAEMIEIDEMIKLKLWFWMLWVIVWVMLEVRVQYLDIVKITMGVKEIGLCPFLCPERKFGIFEL